MYKQISKEKVRFQALKGELTVEQLWDLNLVELDNLAVSLEKDYKESKGKSFLEKKTTKDKGIKLQFDVVLDILNTKVEENEIAQNAEETKAHNQKILGLIKQKQDSKLECKSIKELEKMLK